MGIFRHLQVPFFATVAGLLVIHQFKESQTSAGLFSSLSLEGNLLDPQSSYGTQHGPDCDLSNDATVPPKESLEDSPLRYYLYTEQAIAQYGIVERNQLLGEDELIVIEAFSDHHLRTLDPYEADMFIAPIPFNMMGSGKRIGISLDALFQTPSYQMTKGHRHIMIALGGRIFDAFVTKGERMKGIVSRRKQLENITVARDHDMYACVEMIRNESTNHHEWQNLFWGIQPMTKYAFSVGIQTGKSLHYIPATYEKFSNSSLFLFFHTRKTPEFARFSTQYRHVLIPLIDQLTVPVSVGFGLNSSQWIHDMTHSKFCLVVRGDTPHSHTLLRAIKVGCIPVIVSDYYPVYAPTLKSSLNMMDYSIFIDEKVFLKDPIGSLKRIQDISSKKIKEKIKALAYAQRVALPDHPDSLFVNAFLKEALFAQRNNYSLMGGFL